jgi:hypothetical protein
VTLRLTAGSAVVSSVPLGTVVTLTATVKAGPKAVTTGLVNFCDAAASTCTDIHLLGSAQLTSAGTAVVKLRPRLGQNGIKAVFKGTWYYDPCLYNPCASALSSLSVTGGVTSSSITRSGTAGSYALTGKVTGSGSRTAPGGKVSFVDTTNSNMVLGTAALGAGTVVQSFSAPLNYGTSDSPGFAATGDFNGDGIQDFVSTSSGNTVSVLIGKVDGTFSEPAAYPTGGVSPSCIAVGDFNEDGFPDLAIANHSSRDSGTVGVLLGNGDGTFGAPTTYQTGNSSNSLAIGDFNGDGVADITLAGDWIDGVFVLLGKPDGTFAAGVASTPIFGKSVVVGDFNRDGFMDVASVIPVSNNVEVLLGKGDGTFGDYLIYPVEKDVQSVTVGDLNGDGVLDLAVANGSSNTVNILLGKGDGTFKARVAYAAGGSPSSIVLADFNGDGIPDIAFIQSSGTTVGVLLGKGDGTFDPVAAWDAGSSFAGLVARDFNGDGVPDLAADQVDATGHGNVSILLNQLTTTATAALAGVSAASGDQVKATYPGDSIYAGSSSSPVSLTAGVPTVPPVGDNSAAAQSLTVPATPTGAGMDSTPLPEQARPPRQ